MMFCPYLLTMILSYIFQPCASTSGKMSGIHLRIGAVEEYGSLYIVKDPTNGTTRHLGVVPDIIDLLSERLNFTFSYVDIPLSLAGTMGLTNASIRYLLEDKIDLVSSMTVATPERLKLMDFTSALLINSYSILQPMPEIESQLFAIVIPFRPLVWLMIFLSIIIIIGTLTLVNRFNPGSNTPDISLETDLNSNINYVVPVLLGQGGSISSGRVSFRIVAAAFCLTAIVLVNVYNSALTSRLSAPKYEPIINSLEELADSRKDVLVPKGTVLASIFMNAKSGSSYQLEESLRRHPDNQFESVGELMTKLHSGCCAHPATEMYACVLVNRAITPSGKCTLTTSKLIQFYQSFSFAVPKHAAWLQAMNQEIGYLMSNGILNKWIEKVANKHITRRCQLKQVKPEKKPVTLTMLSSAFLILGIGTTISIVVFITEVLRRRASITVM